MTTDDHARSSVQQVVSGTGLEPVVSVESLEFMRELYQAAKKCGRSMGYDDDDNSDAASGVRMAFIRGAQWATKQSGACSANY